MGDGNLKPNSILEISKFQKIEVITCVPDFFIWRSQVSAIRIIFAILVSQLFSFDIRVHSRYILSKKLKYNIKRFLKSVIFIH